MNGRGLPHARVRTASCWRLAKSVLPYGNRLKGVGQRVQCSRYHHFAHCQAHLTQPPQMQKSRNKKGQQVTANTHTHVHTLHTHTHTPPYTHAHYPTPAWPQQASPQPFCAATRDNRRPTMPTSPMQPAKQKAGKDITPHKPRWLSEAGWYAAHIRPCNVTPSNHREPSIRQMVGVERPPNGKTGAACVAPTSMHTQQAKTCPEQTGTQGYAPGEWPQKPNTAVAADGPTLRSPRKHVPSNHFKPSQSKACPALPMPEPPQHGCGFRRRLGLAAAPEHAVAVAAAAAPLLPLLPAVTLPPAVMLLRRRRTGCPNRAASPPR